MNEDLLTRLRKWHAANLPEDNSPYNPMDIKDMVAEVITYIEDLELALREEIGYFYANRQKDCGEK